MINPVPQHFAKRVAADAVQAAPDPVAARSSGWIAQLDAVYERIDSSD